MANEVQSLQLPDYSIEYTPTQIKIHNLDQLQRAVNAYATKYQNIVVTDTTEKEAKSILAELRKLSTALDDKRKEIKKDYNKPYNDFASQIKELRSYLDSSIDPLNDSLKELDQHHRDDRLQQVKTLIQEMAPNYQVSAADVEILPKWLNKTTSQKQITEGIAATMIEIKREDDKLKADVTTVTKYAEVQGIDPTGWVDQVKQGQDVEYLLKQIDYNVQKKQEQQRIVEAKAAEERTHQKQQGDAIVDTNTGEVVSKEYVLKITGTTDQMWALRHYMDKQGILYAKA